MVIAPVNGIFPIIVYVARFSLALAAERVYGTSVTLDMLPGESFVSAFFLTFVLGFARDRVSGGLNSPTDTRRRGTQGGDG
jgi:hypothetical protein